MILINPGKAKHKIEIQHKVIEKDELGCNIKVWSKYKTLYAEKTQLKGYQTATGERYETNYNYRFKVRYRTDLHEDMRILYKGQIYDIKHINPISELNLYETHIDCVHTVVT